MRPSLAWLDLTTADRNRMRRVLDLFEEKGTVDELGLGTLRDLLSETLFPGTSSIQTRLRYVLFVPWIYQRLEKKGVSAADVEVAARKAELALIDPLSRQTDTDGIIGFRARGSLKRLPSAVFWSALVRWGLFIPARSQSWYHARFGTIDQIPNMAAADDPGVTWSRNHSWHPRIPKKPKSFPKTVAFDLSNKEAEFLGGQIEAHCSGTLLAWLVKKGRKPKGDFWNEPAVGKAPEPIKAVVALAERFSLHVEGAPLLYNLMLAENHQEAFTDGDSDWCDHYRKGLARWARAESKKSTFVPQTLWTYVFSQGGRLTTGQKTFVERWSKLVSDLGADAIADSQDARRLVREREIFLKGGRSRFTNEKRLFDWSGRAGVGRMDFRWSRVKQLLTDLHRGLEA